jgi:hypothetical protein
MTISSTIISITITVQLIKITFQNWVLNIHTKVAF